MYNLNAARDLHMPDWVAVLVAREAAFQAC